MTAHREDKNTTDIHCLVTTPESIHARLAGAVATPGMPDSTAYTSNTAIDNDSDVVR